VSKELKKRLYTSVILFFLLMMMYFYSYVLIIGVILISIITWIEFYALVSKIFVKNKIKDKLLRFIYKTLSLLYLFILTFIILYVEAIRPDLKIIIIYSLLVSILSDLGGLIFGKIFKGPKLIKISPKKTISGSIGAFASSILLIPFFSVFLENYGFTLLIVITLLLSLTSQSGDLFISFVKRKAKVKNTSDLLPGHGGFLDRIDGIIFAIPVGFLLFKIFN
jgi:phosphatidate cytidylyltransferase